MRFHDFQGVSVGIIYLRAAPMETCRWGMTKKANNNVIFSWIRAQKLLRMQQSEVPQTLTQRGPVMGLSIPGHRGRGSLLLVMAVSYTPSYTCK